MRETLLLDVPHRQVVFTIPKMLRVFFKYKRRLLGNIFTVGVGKVLDIYIAPTPRFKGDLSTLPGPRRCDLWGAEA